MATTSIWAVKGWLGKVVLYIENPDKTDNPKFYRQEELTDVQTQSLSDVIDYAVRAEKTTVTRQRPGRYPRVKRQGCRGVPLFADEWKAL